MKRPLVIIALLLVVLVAVPVALLFYAAYSAHGLQLVASHIPSRIGRAKISISPPSGTLAGGFEVARIEIDHDLSHLVFEGAKGRIAVLPLLWKTVDMREVTLRNAFIQVRRRTGPPGKGTPRFLPPGITVRMEGGRSDALTLIATNGRRFDTTGVQMSGVARHRRMRFFDSSFTWEAMSVSGSVDLAAGRPMGISGNGRITLSWPRQPVWAIDAAAEGTLAELGIDAAITAPFRADFKGSARDLTRRWNWSGDAKVHDFDLRAWGGGGALGRISGTLAVHGNARGFGGRGPLTPAGLGAGAFDSLFEGSYAARVVTADRIELRHPSGAYLHGAGTITVAQSGPRLDLSGGWQDFRWPLVGKDPAVRSATGGYHLSGVWPYDWRAQGPLSVRGLEPMPTEAVGRLAKDRVHLDAVAVDAFAGHADLVGEISWSPDIRWSATGRAAGVNPMALRKDLPGKLDFEFAAQGKGFGGDDFGLTLRDVKGSLRGVTASGSGRISRLGEAWTLDDIRVGLGRTRIEADGRIAQRIDLSFSIDAEDLSWVEQDSRGRLRAKGEISGSAQDPVIVATAQGSGIQHGGIGLGRLDASIDFDPRSTRTSSIDVRTRDLTFGERKFQQLDLSLEGPASAHVAQVDARMSDLRLQMRAAGAFAHGIWTGQMNGLDLESTESMRLQLESPAALVASTRQLRLDPFCLRGEPARVCADAQWNPTRWAGAFSATDLPIRTLTAALSPTVEYRGRLTVTARAFAEQGSPVQGELRADLTDARMVHQLASGRRQSILLGSGVLTANATPASIDARVGLDAGPVGTIDGHIALTRSTTLWRDMPLQGELRMRTAELGYITLYAPQIDRAAGRLETDLTLSGTAGHPLVDGTIRLSEAELDQYQVNLTLRDASLTAQLQGNALSFEGGARIGKGRMSTRGNLEWRDSLPYGRFHLEGQGLRVADVPEARIDASPNLDFEIAGQRIAVQGSVIVPYAKITPTDLRNAVRASSDEVLVGNTSQAARKRFEAVTDIDLTLADRVSLETSGLTGRLAGSLRLRSGQDEMTTGTGELSIAEGKYTAYGRKLDIEHGRLIFSGGPVANPAVDIRAVKQFPEVVAGVNVRGTLQQPRLSFYSEPSLPQSQVLSLILAGGSLSSNTQGGPARQNGSGELLAQGGAILAQQLGAKVGLEDVSVEQNLDNETSLVLGKYLSPRLYVSYGISLAESINTLKMRYSLNDHWTVRSEVGEARGADLVYTIEK